MMRSSGGGWDSLGVALVAVDLKGKVAAMAATRSGGKNEREESR